MYFSARQTTRCSRSRSCPLTCARLCCRLQQLFDCSICRAQILSPLQWFAALGSRCRLLDVPARFAPAIPPRCSAPAGWSARPWETPSASCRALPRCVRDRCLGRRPSHVLLVVVTCSATMLDGRPLVIGLHVVRSGHPRPSLSRPSVPWVSLPGPTRVQSHPG